jgi:polysaccharide pyruvyl transferase WcaK-like protein
MRRAVVAMCNEAQIFAVRDAESVALAVAYGIPRHHIIETADAALALTSDDLNEKAQEEIAADLSPLQGTRMIGLHLSSPSEAEKHAVPMVSKLLDRISSQSDYTLVIFNDSPGEPIPRAYRKLISQHENSLRDRMIKLFYKSVDHQLALLQQLNVVMTNKLHVGICASAFGKQVLSIPLHTKIIRFYRQINKENNCIMPQDLPKLDIFDKITDMISTGPVVLPTSIRERALMNRDLIEQYMCNIMTRE